MDQYIYKHTELYLQKEEIMGILEHLESYLDLDDFIDLEEDIDKVVD
jgi:hypothetical protein